MFQRLACIDPRIRESTSLIYAVLLTSTPNSRKQLFLQMNVDSMPGLTASTMFSWMSRISSCVVVVLVLCLSLQMRSLTLKVAQVNHVLGGL